MAAENQSNLKEFVHTMPNGEKIVLRRCWDAQPSHGDAQLYCSQDGQHFFAVTRATIRELKLTYTPNRPSKRGGGHAQYKYVSEFHLKACHIAVYEAWVGKRKRGMQIDHLNGDPLDNRVDNLEMVTPEENIKRAKLLRIMRSSGRDPRQLSRDELLRIFRRYRIDPSFDQMAYEMTHHCEI